MTIQTSDPVAHQIAAAANVVGSWTSPVTAVALILANEGTAWAFVTVDGPAPTVGGDGQFAVGPGSSVTVRVASGQQTSLPTGYTGPVVQAISSAALTLYVEVSP